MDTRFVKFEALDGRPIYANPEWVQRLMGGESGGRHFSELFFGDGKSVAVVGDVHSTALALKGKASL